MRRNTLLFTLLLISLALITTAAFSRTERCAKERSNLTQACSPGAKTQLLQQ